MRISDWSSDVCSSDLPLPIWEYRGVPFANHIQENPSREREMKAALFKAVGEPLAIEDVPDPEPGEGEAVIRVARCGVCGTDLHSTSGHGYTLPAGAQLGHEYAGEVVAVGRGVRRLKVGDRVAALPVVGCGECEACRTGIDVLCSRWRGYGGGLADYARITLGRANV